MDGARLKFGSDALARRRGDIETHQFHRFGAVSHSPRYVVSSRPNHSVAPPSLLASPSRNPPPSSHTSLRLHRWGRPVVLSQGGESRVFCPFRSLPYSSSPPSGRRSVPTLGKHFLDPIRTRRWGTFGLSSGSGVGRGGTIQSGGSGTSRGGGGCDERSEEPREAASSAADPQAIFSYTEVLAQCSHF
eukprot:4773915-Prymnesium_polylepis.2